MKQRKIKPEPTDGGKYFTGKEDAVDAVPPSVNLLPSGCVLFDCMVSGGRKGCYPEGRITNIVGDKSAGKTLLAIEECANYAQTYTAKEADIYYAEAEAAFDEGYAENQGLPLARMTFPAKDEPFNTVEDFFNLLQAIIAKKRRALVVLDSLDALSDDAEMDRDMSKGSFGAEKAKKLGQLFRRTVRKLQEYNITVIIISQLRDKIGVMFGETKTRTGGRALDYYASVIVWLAQISQIKRTIAKVERTVGVEIVATCKKNKVGKPFRKVKYPILFDYGIDDVTAGCAWLNEVGYAATLKSMGVPVDADERGKYLRTLADDDFYALKKVLNKTVRHVWNEVEAKFAPPRRKY